MTSKSPGMRLEQARRVRARDLPASDVPTGPGVYCWWDGVEPLFVAAAEDLHHQLVEVETGPPRGRVPEFRQFARARAQELGDLGYGEDRPTIRAAVKKRIQAWSVSWISTRSITSADIQAAKARMYLLGQGDPWSARPGEDRWLRRYLDDLWAMGRVYVEVPVGGASGGATRRIDAVRFPDLRDTVISKYSPAAFRRDLDLASQIELIEVKRTLNRPVIGQLLVARDLAVREWGVWPSVRVDLVALVTVSDYALEDFCGRNGIRVEAVDFAEGDREAEGY